MLRCLVAAAMLAAVAHGQTTVGSALTGQSGSSFPGSCPISKLSDVIVTTVATLPESTTGPLTVNCHVPPIVVLFTDIHETTASAGLPLSQ